MKSNWSPLVLTRVSLAALVAALLLACGGESAGPSTPPPPPPFQPQTVVVQLGSKGGATTLISTQAGGWTRNGQPFTSGSEVTGENAAKYKLTLANGTWTAEFVPPEPVPLALGISGDAVSLQAQEDGSFELDGKALTSGTVVDAKNGNQYKLVLGSDGDWMAEFVPPAPQGVTLGTSGESRKSPPRRRQFHLGRAASGNGHRGHGAKPEQIYADSRNRWHVERSLRAAAPAASATRDDRRRAAAGVPAGKRHVPPE